MHDPRSSPRHVVPAALHLPRDDDMNRVAGLSINQHDGSKRHIMVETKPGVHRALCGYGRALDEHRVAGWVSCVDCARTARILDLRLPKWVMLT